MNYTAPLYVASQSPMRRALLTQARIPFTLIEQSADESACDWSQEPKALARAIALSKMNHARVPASPSSTVCFVLTADTICVDREGTSHGKPRDEKDAFHMLTLWRHGSTVITAFCLDKKAWAHGSWQTIERIEESVTSSVEFSVPDVWFQEYLAHTPAMNCAGAMQIEDYGFQFVKSITGSYTNIVGLPLFEVREALTKLGFFIF